MSSKEIKSYKDLVAWQKALELVKLTYRSTEKFPKQELYGIASQMRRAATSIPSNIAEGHEQKTTGQFRQGLGIAKGSLAELETLAIPARDFGYSPADEFRSIETLASEVGRLINGLIWSLK